MQGEAAENAAVTGNPIQVGGRYDATPRTLGDGDVGGIALDADGAVQISDGGNSLTVDNADITTLAGAVSGSEMQVDIVSGDVTNAGTFAVQISDTSFAVADGNALGEGVLIQGDDGTDRKNVNVDATTGDVQVDITHTVTVDNGGTFAVQVDAALPAGANAIGKLAANSGVDIGDVDVLSIAAGSNLVGDVGLSGARTSGGTTPYYNDGTATETQIKGSGGQIYWIHAMNLRSSVAYLQVFDALAASVTPGTTTPTNEFVLPTQGDTNGAGFTLSIPNGLAYGTGITFVVTTTKGGATAVAANEVLLNLGYA